MCKSWEKLPSGCQDHMVKWRRINEILWTISTIGFLHTLKCHVMITTVCRNCVAPVICMKMPRASASTTRLLLELKSSHYRVIEGVLTTYSQVMNHLLETHPTNDIITDTDSKTALYVKPLTISQFKLPMRLSSRSLDVLMIMTSMSSSGSLSSGYHSPLCLVCKHT